MSFLSSFASLQEDMSARSRSHRDPRKPARQKELEESLRRHRWKRKRGAGAMAILPETQRMNWLSVAVAMGPHRWRDVQTKLADQPEQVGPLEPEGLRGVRPVTAVRFERSREQLSLEALDFLLVDVDWRPSHPLPPRCRSTRGSLGRTRSPCTSSSRGSG